MAFSLLFKEGLKGEFIRGLTTGLKDDGVGDYSRSS